MGVEQPVDADALLAALKALANPVRLQIMDWLREPDVEFSDYEPIADRDAVGVCVSHIQAKSGYGPAHLDDVQRARELDRIRDAFAGIDGRNPALIRQGTPRQDAPGTDSSRRVSVD